MSQTVQVSLDHLTSLLEKLDTTARLETNYYSQQLKKKSRTIDLIITSEHVDDDEEIDDIDSIDIEKMMESERGVTLTVMHSDTIVGNVMEMEKTTIGEVAKRYPESADRLNVPINEHVKCILGKARMYDDTPELDNLVWHLIKVGKKEPKQGLSAVSLRGVGHTHEDSKVCDPEKKCGKQVTKTKFWSVTLCPDGEQAKPYSVILRDSIDEKIKMASDDNDCGGTKSEFNELTTKLSQFETQLQELKTKMAKKKKDYDDEDGEVPGEQDTGPDEKMKEKDCPKCNEKMSYKKGAKTVKCKACGETHDMEKKKMDDKEDKDEKEKMSGQDQVKMVQVPEPIIEQLIESDKQWQKIKQREKLSPTQQYLSERFGDTYQIGTTQQTKMTSSLDSNNNQLTPVKLQKMIRSEFQKIIKEAPEELGLSKSRTPETGGDGVTGIKRQNNDTDPDNSTPDNDRVASFDEAQNYLIKTRGENNFSFQDIMNIIQGKVKMKQEIQ